MKSILIKTIKSLLTICMPLFHNRLKMSINDAKEKIFDNYKEKELNVLVDKDNNNNKYSYNLSFIIPVYNSEKFIRNCILSIINQATKYSYEVILIDDGSTDKSNKIIKKITNKYDNIKLIRQKNSGAAATRNVGLDNASGEYIAFIDADDFIDEMYVEKLLNKAYEKNADIVKCGYYEYLVADDKILKTVTTEDFSIKGKINKQLPEIKGFLWASVMRATLWNKIRFPENYWYEDMIMRLLILRLCNNFEYIKDTLYCYNNHENNLSKKVDRTSDSSCLDSMFLAIKLFDLNNQLKIEMNEGMYKSILYELTVILWLRTRYLEPMLRKSAFIIACDFVNQNIPNDIYLFNKDELKMLSAYKKFDYLQWQLNSLNIMIGVKYGI